MRETFVPSRRNPRNIPVRYDCCTGRCMQLPRPVVHSHQHPSNPPRSPSPARLTTVDSSAPRLSSLPLTLDFSPHCRTDGAGGRFSCRRLPLLLQSCRAACSPHVSYLPTLGHAQTPAHPYRHKPPRPSQTNETTTPASPFFNSVAVARRPCATTSLFSFQSFRSPPSLISRRS